MSRNAAPAKALEALSAMTVQEDNSITQAALADPDARPLDEERLARMRPASSADLADIKRRLRGRPYGLDGIARSNKRIEQMLGDISAKLGG